MKLLIDTHVLVWMALSDEALTPAATSAIRAEDNDLLVSAVTAWELTDLALRGRFPPMVRLEPLIERFALQEVGFPATAWRQAEMLPDIHRDPVDRMLIAHALAIEATVVTADRDMRRYPVPTLW